MSVGNWILSTQHAFNLIKHPLHLERNVRALVNGMRVERRGSRCGLVVLCFGLASVAKRRHVKCHWVCGGHRTEWVGRIYDKLTRYSTWQPRLLETLMALGLMYFDDIDARQFVASTIFWPLIIRDTHAWSINHRHAHRWRSVLCRVMINCRPASHYKRIRWICN